MYIINIYIYTNHYITYNCYYQELQLTITTICFLRSTLTIIYIVYIYTIACIFIIDVIREYL